MHFSKFSIKNFKCFDHVKDIYFKNGINLIVGKNNSGKTTLLDLLALKSYAQKLWIGA